jgi:hypothetical protein
MGKLIVFVFVTSLLQLPLLRHINKLLLKVHRTNKVYICSPSPCRSEFHSGCFTIPKGLQPVHRDTEAKKPQGYSQGLGTACYILKFPSSFICEINWVNYN